MESKEISWEIQASASYPILDENIEADVLIIGAGIAGIFSAYLLSKAGLKVVVLEKESKILQHATLLTTAFITQIIDTSFSELVSILGPKKAKLVWQSGQEAIAIIADIIKKEQIDCAFQFVSAYTYASNENQFKKLSKEYAAIKKLGFDAKLQKDSFTLPFKNAGFLEIPLQAKFHPIEFTEGLAKAAQALGATFFTDSKVLAIEGLTVKTQAGQVKAKNIVIATYAPFTNQGTRFRKAMYVSYVCELEIAKQIFPEALYLDMQNPYHYFRVDGFKNTDRMIVGGEDHRADVKVNPQKSINALKKYIATILGENNYTITRQWSGPILESVDGLPLIGAIKPSVFVATAFSGNGMTYAPIAATIIRDAILKKENSYSDLYDIKRIPGLLQLTVKGFDYMVEFFGGAFKNFFSSK